MTGFQEYNPSQRDIVCIDFSPQAGREIANRRPGLVLSRREFNRKLKLAYIAPITNTKREEFNSFRRELPPGLTVQGYVLLDQVRSFDFRARNAEYRDRVDEDFFDECLDLLEAIFWTHPEEA